MANIIKGRFNQPFVTLYNEAVQDPALSMQAKGLHAYLLSLPEEWKIHTRELPNHFTNGRDAVTNTLNELINNGYVVRRELRDVGKFGGYHYEVYPLKYPRAIEMGLIIPDLETQPEPKKAAPKEDKPSATANVPFKDIIDHLNNCTGKKFKHTSKGNQTMIRARWKDGHSVDDFKHVIEVKAEEWLGTEWDKYLCPETLFRPGNFEKYLNQKRKGGKNGKASHAAQLAKTNELPF